MTHISTRIEKGDKSLHITIDIDENNTYTVYVDGELLDVDNYPAGHEFPEWWPDIMASDLIDDLKSFYYLVNGARIDE